MIKVTHFHRNKQMSVQESIKEQKYVHMKIGLYCLKTILVYFNDLNRGGY